MKPIAWTLAVVALLVLTTATTAGHAGDVALPCVVIGAGAWLALAVTDHLENRRS